MLPVEPSHVIPLLLERYGSIGLFFLLALGIFGLPIPDETLLVLSGFMMAKGRVSLYAIPLAAVLGSSFGITLSYLLGLFAGKNLLIKYGKWFGLSEKKVTIAHNWFEKFGKWLLIIGYYIPGIRHLSGFIAGAVYLSYWQFALFAYIGAIIWGTTFLSIGYFFFNAWQRFAGA